MVDGERSVAHARTHARTHARKGRGDQTNNSNNAPIVIVVVVIIIVVVIVTVVVAIAATEKQTKERASQRPRSGPREAVPDVRWAREHDLQHHRAVRGRDVADEVVGDHQATAEAQKRSDHGHKWRWHKRA